jgi:hypothetical protein
MVAGFKQKVAEGLVTFVRNITLTCYGKQFAILNFWQYAGYALSLNILKPGNGCWM